MDTESDGMDGTRHGLVVVARGTKSECNFKAFL